MMDFRIEIDIPKSEIEISHRSHILMFGSCFIENIGKLLVDNRFNVNLNPFGILYNPASIARNIRVLLDNYEFSDNDIFEYKGLFNSFCHHGSFSDVSKERCLSKICKSTNRASEDIKKSDVLIFTFGTSYVFRHKEKDIVVGNCHKLPTADFDRYRLRVEDIVGDWSVLIKQIRQHNPDVKIIFTVSPIRHMKDGAHDNQLSKSVLLLAVDELCKSNEDCQYFPSYEIVLDELRDYRFYNEDMIHPNGTAVKYIWDRFSDAYIGQEAKSIMDEWNKIHLALNHRPLNPQSDEYKHFLRQTLLKIEAFENKYPYICCREEVSSLKSRL